MLNKLRFPNCPYSLRTLRYGCSVGTIPGAFKLGKKWFVDLTIFDNAIAEHQTAIINDRHIDFSDKSLTQETDKLLERFYGE